MAVMSIQKSVEIEETAGFHILVVEDNRDGRESLHDLLEIWGHQVSVAETGPEAIEKTHSALPDVALVDIGLPGFNGNEVARRIRSQPGGEAVYLIAMSGYGQPEDRRRALLAGFDSYLVKPVDPAVLFRFLSLLRSREEARQDRGPRLG